MCIFKSDKCVWDGSEEPSCAPEIAFQSTADSHPRGVVCVCVCVLEVVRTRKGCPPVVCQGHMRLV